MSIFDNLTDKVKKAQPAIVLPDGPDLRILDAASRLSGSAIMKVILVGTEEEFVEGAKKGGYDISGCEIIDLAKYAGMDGMIKTMVELRKGKITEGTPLLLDISMLSSYCMNPAIFIRSPSVISRRDGTAPIAINSAFTLFTTQYLFFTPILDS